MKDWDLVDCREPLGESNPRLEVRSETHLRQELGRLCQRRRAGTVMLGTPTGDCLGMSLGGPFATLGWYPPPEQEKSLGRKQAIPEVVNATEAVDNWCEGVPLPIAPDHLFQVREVIEAAIYFFNHHRLPEWLKWETWDPIGHHWEVKPATEMARPVSGS